MGKPICIKDILSHKDIYYLKNKATRCLKEMHEDYFSEKSFEQFCIEHLGHTSVVSKALAYRFFSEDIIKFLKKVFYPWLSNKYGYDLDNLIFYPVFYLRYAFPELYQDLNYKNAFLDSQPHYDQTFGLKQYTFWVPLVDINHETGGLCYFNNDEVSKLFNSTDGKNAYNTDSYYKNAQHLDKILKKYTVAPEIKSGNVLSFDSTVLHGATKSISKWRTSFDFRLTDKSFLYSSNKNIKKILNIFIEKLELCHAKNLEVVGDYIGAYRYYDKLGSNYKKDLSRVNKLKIQSSFTEPFTNQHWSKEFSWI